MNRNLLLTFRRHSGGRREGRAETTDQRFPVEPWAPDQRLRHIRHRRKHHVQRPGLGTRWASHVPQQLPYREAAG